MPHSLVDRYMLEQFILRQIVHHVDLFVVVGRQNAVQYGPDQLRIDDGPDSNGKSSDTTGLRRGGSGNYCWEIRPMDPQARTRKILTIKL